MLFFTPSRDLRKAACKGMDLDIFFGSETRSDAKRICRGCTVRQSCLEDCLEMEHTPGHAKRHGVRGGLTERERNQIYGKLDQEPDEVLGDGALPE